MLYYCHLYKSRSVFGYDENILRRRVGTKFIFELRKTLDSRCSANRFIPFYSRMAGRDQQCLRLVTITVREYAIDGERRRRKGEKLIEKEKPNNWHHKSKLSIHFPRVINRSTFIQTKRRPPIQSAWTIHRSSRLSSVFCIDCRNTCRYHCRRCHWTEFRTPNALKATKVSVTS